MSPDQIARYSREAMPVIGTTAFESAAAAAGVTSAMFPSKYPIGSVLDDLSARPERAKALGTMRVRNLLARAEHFLIDEEAGARVVQTVEKNGQLIRDLREFAIMPYPVMTISLPTRAVHDADRETLLLVEEHDGLKRFALVLRQTGTGDIITVPGWYVGLHDARDDKSMLVIRTDGDNMPPDDLTKRQVATYSMALNAVLLFLNQKKGVHISAPTSKRKSLRAGRPTTYFARRTITLSIDAPAELVRHHATATREACRRHAVRGHFFHRGGVPTCEHRWARLDGWENAWECVDCDRRRFWRRDFERGDLEKGVVASRYVLTGGGA